VRLDECTRGESSSRYDTIQCSDRRTRSDGDLIKKVSCISAALARSGVSSLPGNNEDAVHAHKPA
jgi:hypothetical protein